jgi:tetratricopeptide (TPR) repeat protein
MGAVLMLGIAALAQSNNQQPPAQPATGQQGGQSGAAQPGTAQPGTAQAPAKHPPQAKTQPEFDDYKKAVALNDPAAMEAAANDFATKYPDSELRKPLYLTNLRLYQSSNPDKTIEVGRKVLAIDPDDPEALVTVASVLAERTRDTDLDKDQRLDEAVKMAQRATETINSDSDIPAGTPKEKEDAYKALIVSNAYSIMGTVKFNKGDYKGAEADLRKSIDAYPPQPDPVAVLRLALTLDKQNRYPEALDVAGQAAQIAPESTQVGDLARKECDRLVQLSGKPKPAACNAGAAPGAPPK